MPQIKPPAIETAISDFDLFAKAYFNIELTQYQKNIIKSLMRTVTHYQGKNPEKRETAEVLRLYIAEGMKPGGRHRLPQIGMPPRPKIKGVTQEGRILNAIKQGGAFNFELSRIALKYTSVISELRKDGHNIIAERQIGRNGKKSNTFKYYLIGE